MMSDFGEYFYPPTPAPFSFFLKLHISAKILPAHLCYCFSNIYSTTVHKITKIFYYLSDYVDHFHSLFPYEDKKVVLVGNHDIGFHYDVTDKKRKRFYGAFAQDTSG